MNEHATGQVASSAAEVYEQFFVPALFGDWPQKVLTAAQVQSGERVLDVACGTGVLARAAARRVGAGGRVTGVDINEGMLAVARAMSPEITWENASAEALPFEDGSFDKVLSQFGLMFFRDQAKAIEEMCRVTRPGGRVVIAVWAELEATPGYAVVAQVLEELFGADVAESIKAPYSLGDMEVLLGVLKRAGAADVEIQTLPGTARFKSVEDWMYTDVKGWTLADVIDDQGYQRLKAEAPARLAEFVKEDGSVEFDAPAHIVIIDV